MDAHGGGKALCLGLSLGLLPEDWHLDQWTKGDPPSLRVGGHHPIHGEEARTIQERQHFLSSGGGSPSPD